MKKSKEDHLIKSLKLKEKFNPKRLRKNNNLKKKKSQKLRKKLRKKKLRESLFKNTWLKRRSQTLRKKPESPKNSRRLTLRKPKELVIELKQNKTHSSNKNSTVLPLL